MLADKDIAGSLAPLAGMVDTWLLADLDVPRGASAAVLATAINGAGLAGHVECFASPAQAFARSPELAGENGRIIVFGSFYTVAAIQHSMHLVDDRSDASGLHR
ncbi:MAG: Bifunctional protein FolC [Candidatus Accumulibacter phosphatis]|uniref:Bifunctional protein FolC n=1 Tax=Candidatus Accumulibacter phosphatis TaxID=327160 RepID=A0A080LSC7_9PROT|nr:MAG: Bifunctional protein FolC [Candidatus Accumulibacter phosphatis]